jgi:two-component system OmpR family sensor kinase
MTTDRNLTTDSSHAAPESERAAGRVPIGSNTTRADALAGVDPESASQESGLGADDGSSLSELVRRCEVQARRIAEVERDLHALSHAIRSPLVALKGFAGLLRDEISDSASENGIHFLSRIVEAGRRIEHRLDDLGQLLDVSEQNPNRSWVDPRPLIEALAAEFKPALDESGMRILLSHDTPLIHCDRSQLETALTHLIGNALQHASPSEPRHVQIRIERDDTHTRVLVIDSGPGMDEALARRAFEPFDCAGDRRRRFDDDRESSGIGLALVGRIAAAHGGAASIDTTPGGGTTVVMTFPHA